MQNYLANGLKFYFPYTLKAVIAVYAKRVFGSRQSLTMKTEKWFYDFHPFFLLKTKYRN